MWIRSQNKKSLLNVNQIEISPSVDKSKYYICNSLKEESVTLGEYSTEEKALKVLDQIQYNMELFEHELTMVFQMPTDTEVDEV